MNWLKKVSDVTGDLTELFIQLDMLLTGKERRQAEHMSINQSRRLDDFFDWYRKEYYLSDGGYSRVMVRVDEETEPPTSYLFVTSNSLDRVKQSWDNPEVKNLRAQIESQINAFLATF